MTANRSATATRKTSARSRDILDFLARSGAITSPGTHASLLDPLPKDVSALAGIVQGLNIHEYMASAYGVTIPEERKSETHIRSLEKRLVGVCNHFAVFMVGALRASSSTGWPC